MSGPVHFLYRVTYHLPFRIVIFQRFGRVDHRFNVILQGPFQAGSTQGGHKVPAAFFSETVKTTAIKLGTLTN